MVVYVPGGEEIAKEEEETTKLNELLLLALNDRIRRSCLSVAEVVGRGESRPVGKRHHLEKGRKRKREAKRREKEKWT
jgi:hypothetical protein